jgi:hypothetical protein
MPTIQTDMRETLDWMTARRIRYEPQAAIAATNVQDAIQAVQANVVAAASSPPAIVPTAVNFAMSPYTVLATDYLLEVDTSGGAITIQTQASASRANKPFTVKDISGNAAANNISVVRTGAETLDGLTTYPLDSDFRSLTFKPKLAGTGYEVES